MIIIPDLLEKNMIEVRNKFAPLAPFSNKVHIDVMDGILSPNKNDIVIEEAYIPDWEGEIYMHLMVSEFSEIISWFDHDIKSIAIHSKVDLDWNLLNLRAEERDIELINVLDFDEDAEEIFPHLGFLDSIMLMTVKTGASQQKLIPSVLDKIKILRKYRKDVKIYVDGGVNMDNLPILVEAGVDVAFVNSAIFLNTDPVRVFLEMQEKAK